MKHYKSVGFLSDLNVKPPYSRLSADGSGGHPSHLMICNTWLSLAATAHA